VQQQVTDDDTLLLEYALGRERSYVWAVTSGTVMSYQLPPRDRIERAAQAVYGPLTARNREVAGETALQRKRRVLSAEAQLEAAARDLSDLLLRPVVELLPGRRLVIVAEGALQYVPFGALPEPTKAASRAFGDPLIVGHEIVSSPSASTIAVLRRDRQRQTEGLKTLAVVADPVFSKDDPRLRQRTVSRQAAAISPSSGPRPDETREVLRSGSDVGLDSFRRLRFSHEEADAIASLTAADDRLEAVDFQASRTTALSAELGGYRIVHFSTHGLLNNAHPELSGLVLSLYDERGRPQDGFLRLHDIYNLNLNADLVVLSACETALGREMKGEGLIGLARGFMYAGASRVVASLWKVEDRATAMLMKRFYEYMLVDGRPAAAALRAAQIDMWRDKRWSTRYYWAGFILEGEWR
jgi:CHAT domain-containing protein